MAAFPAACRSFPLPLLAAQPDDQEPSWSRCPGSVLSLAPAPIDPVQIRRLPWLKGSLASTRLASSGRRGAKGSWSLVLSIPCRFLLCRRHPCRTTDNLGLSRAEPAQKKQIREPGIRTSPLRPVTNVRARGSSRSPDLDQEPPKPIEQRRLHQSPVRFSGLLPAWGPPAPRVASPSDPQVCQSAASSVSHGPSPGQYTHRMHCLPWTWALLSFSCNLQRHRTDVISRHGREEEKKTLTNSSGLHESHENPNRVWPYL